MNYKTLCRDTLVVVEVAAEFIRSQYEKFNPAAVQVKSLNSLVSYVDIESEKLLVASLGRLVPEASFHTEEQTVSDAHKPYQWIIDPLDGTTNFVYHIPVFSISIALYHQGVAVLGIVYDVMHKECFYAYEGGGAYLNGKLISVSGRNHLSECLVATGFPYEIFDYSAHYLSILETLMPQCRGIRRLGSAAIDLAYTACGRFDAFFEYNLNAWDVAAGAYIVQKAGGQVTDFSSTTCFIAHREIIATNNNVHQQMLNLVHDALKK